MVGLIKIGFSTKDPKGRATELSGTGTPHPYVVEYDALVTAPREVEQKVHDELEAQREGKEWFRCGTADAVEAIRQMSGEDLICENHHGRENTEKPKSSVTYKQLLNEIVAFRRGFRDIKAILAEVAKIDTSFLWKLHTHLIPCPHCQQKNKTTNDKIWKGLILREWPVCLKCKEKLPIPENFPSFQGQKPHIEARHFPFSSASDIVSTDESIEE